MSIREDSKRILVLNSEMLRPRVRSHSKKAQMWFGDFTLGVFIFTFMLIAFYIYTASVLKPDVASMDLVISDAQAASSSLIGAGTPLNWTNATVTTIGITNNDHRVNRSKLHQFNALSYNQTRKLFGIASDYYVYFENENQSAINVEGICGVGHTIFNETYNTSVAYYFDSPTDAHLMPYAQTMLSADTYSSQPGYDDIVDLAQNLLSYNVVILEDPFFTLVQLTTHKEAFENFTRSGGKLIVTGELVNAPNQNFSGITFNKKALQTLQDRNATIIDTDHAFDYHIGQDVVFDVAHYVDNTSEAANYRVLQHFAVDNATAVASWDFGNGSLLYASDVLGNNSEFDFAEQMRRAIPLWGTFECNLVDINMISYRNFVRMDRLLITREKPVKMVLYEWR